MNLLTAHAYFASLPDAGLSHLPAELAPSAPTGLDVTPAIATACASLSGQLAECQGLPDLAAACEHFRTLYGAGVVTVEDLNSEALEVIRAVLGCPVLRRMEQAECN
jgi:hypothetical protein